ncbi:S1 family peptidase [Flavobacterium aquatile]|uniref:Serine protease n=1 Tax=Flavobacterium aquatile LMG 4008 = ATCC 11947 TaxID=1453498 RepID=A0A095TZR8_9FLAO|nr:serine protease [Flavobacterium aquatile]KGD67908.1 hypothetical protein LG45_06255 [Flavobacterium aquatile LMG 4008 = ATCC 11947]OXA65417.1 serine protease [Flavobacterium aquatile] [Flavobacterium aquatile LMG 4008 = ATCC 11947]GEC78978.1 hypothetical protein FAQ01_18480 [Flavobacterium aquatile]
MKNSIIKLLIFFISFQFISCSKNIEPESPEKIFEKYKSSVVLIASQYYYEVNDGQSKYYYSPDSQKKIFFTEKEAIENLSFSSGTGFIISEKGEIITNNHVVNNKDENYKVELVKLNEKLKEHIIYNVKKYSDTLDLIKTTYIEHFEQMDYYEKQNLQNRFDFLSNEKDYLAELYRKIEFLDFSNATSKLIIHKLGIAFNDTHVTELDDLQECVVVKTSERENIDLALIQTKNKNFNVKPNYILNFKDNNPNLIENPSKNKERDIKNPIKINEDVFMIGFNRGFSLAKTKQGIKSQFTSGKISQENDGERILYTIPTLEGSSGSPIIDKWGNLVGVNFAKITNSQNFSFGVPVFEVKSFYEN